MPATVDIDLTPSQGEQNLERLANAFDGLEVAKLSLFDATHFVVFEEQGLENHLNEWIALHGDAFRESGTV